MKREPTCGNCRLHNVEKETRSAADMAALGFGRCQLDGPFTFIGFVRSCQFSPSKWEAI